MGAHDAHWDAEYDVVVIGSGAGGLTAALTAKAEGLAAIVLEKDALYGGSSAVSGGGIWVPNNDEAVAAGVQDSYDEALAYLQQVVGDATPVERLKTYLKRAPEMVRFLQRRFGIAYRCVARYPDYYTNVPGSKEGWRSMEPAVVSGKTLGEHFATLRPAYASTMLLERISWTQVEAYRLFSRDKGWVMLTLRMLAQYWLDVVGRFKSKRDRRLTMGQAMVAGLRAAMLQWKVPLKLQCGMESLIEMDGRVVGVVANEGGRKLRILARRGVVLACGGFEANQAMREQYLPKPTSTGWSAAPPINHGDGIRAAQAIGARLKHMDMTWGSPTVYKPGEKHQVPLFVERGMPGCVAVSPQGTRFVNEASAYPDFQRAMYAQGATPAWIVFDATFRHKYSMGIMLPGQMQPDKSLPKDWEDRVYFKADTLAGLAGKIGVPAGALASTVAEINGYAETGVDKAFAKGELAIDRYYSDRNVKPNSCLAPIVKPPFYAIRLDPGDIGTKGGIDVDEHGRALRDDGSVIPGLYATGNTSAALMGPTYPGAGSTLGPAMVFGYASVLHMAGTMRASESSGCPFPHAA
jgi:3-oxosteroid 1-dehydrogenase